MDAETLRIARERIARVFRYLQALNQHRNPAKRQVREQLWLFWLRDLPDHPSIRRGKYYENSGTSGDEKTESGNEQPQADDNFVLKVSRPLLTKPPAPLDSLLPWLKHGWEDASGQVKYHESLNLADKQGGTRSVRFEDSQQRVAEFEDWLTHRDEWARNEKPALAAMKVFEQLYELYGRIDREAERVEVVLGDGILKWRRPDGGIEHPVLLQRLQLVFDPQIPEFTFVEGEHEVELYSALFQSMADVDGKTIARCREELEQGGYHPLNGDATSGFLRRLAVALSSRGEFIGPGIPQGEQEEPRIGREPVLFLRPRTLGFAKAIESVLEDLETREDLAPSLLHVVGVESLHITSEEGTAKPDLVPEPEEILLSKASNPEQIKIAERLECHGSVLVQGPPGTGKTHTIANLIGHLLSEGKSVLVTTHSTKALRVLREHIVEQLRPLCVSVLESDIESRKQLEISVQAISERLTSSDAESLEREAQRLAQQRKTLLWKLQHARKALLDARADEYRDIVVAGEGYPPSEAARKVTQEKGRHDWIPGPVTLGSPLPLSEQELRDLYRTNRTITEEDELELSLGLLKPDELMGQQEFGEFVEEHERLRGADRVGRPDLWNREPLPEDRNSLESLTERMRQALTPATGAENWKKAALFAGLKGGAQKGPWESLLKLVEQVCRKQARVQESLLKHGPTLSGESSLEEQEQTVFEITQHLQDGKSLGRLTLLIYRRWGLFIRQAKVATRPPTEVEHFQALRDLIHLQMLRRELVGRWDRQVGPLGGPSTKELGDQPELICAQLSPIIRTCLGWYSSIWKPLQDELSTLGFRWEAFIAEQPPNFSPYGDLLRLCTALEIALPPLLQARINALHWGLLTERLLALTQRLERAGGGDAPAQVIRKLQETVCQLDPTGYGEAFQRLVKLWRVHTDLQRRNQLLTKLEAVAPGWASAIRERRDTHNGGAAPGDVAHAWLWRQLQDELERRGKVSLKELQHQIEELAIHLQRTTTELIDRRSWAAQVRRTGLAQRQALIGWLDTVRRIGKGTGRPDRVARLRLEASRKMSECRSAVPVWVMPLARVVENFDPRSTRFNVVIIDEASQSDIMALLAFYLADRVVVVGDHEQVSPSAVGQDLGVVQHLIDEHLQGIPNSILYDGKTSVYDLARQSFGGIICLVEHFRCVPEIIEFSNQLSYEGRIRPLRDSSLVQLKPNCIAYRVDGARSEEKINLEEARTVASLLIAAIYQPEYKNKTMGVVSLVGDEQALAIQRLLVQDLPPSEYERRRILCGNAAQFQGDERDVMFLSLVDSPQDGPLSLRTEQLFKQRFNVAASRARDQLWVVHSLNPRHDLKQGDLRRRLIEHAEDPMAVIRAINSGEQRTESMLEREVLARLVRAGYRVRPQWKVGYYRIDLVVEGAGRRLAVECDGDRFHPIEKLPEDMARQAILERLGWTFVRIRGSYFFRDPEAAMQPVWEALSSLEIPPEGSEADAALKIDSLGEELKARIIRRADEIRRQWQEMN